MSYIIKIHKHRLLAGLLPIFFLASGYAGDIDEPRSIFDLMHYQEVLDITIETDLDSFIVNRRSDEDIETVLSFLDEDGNRQEWETDITVRGRFRRVHCTTPPLRLDFKKSKLKEAGLAPFDDMKLVTHCVDDPYIAKELILKEYLIYKMYNELTDYSYRVQIVRVTYRNPDTGKEDVQWGFLIEDTAQLSARLGAETFNAMVMTPDSLVDHQLKMVSVFQHMVGNVDWGLKPSKNLQYIQKGDKIIPIPYDFDFADIVGAPYAKPSTQFKRQSAEQVNSLQAIANDQSYKPTLLYFQAHRDDFMSLTKGLKTLSFRSRKEVLSYLRSFFDYNEMVANGAFDPPTDSRERERK